MGEKIKYKYYEKQLPTSNSFAVASLILSLFALSSVFLVWLQYLFISFLTIEQYKFSLNDFFVPILFYLLVFLAIIFGFLGYRRAKIIDLGRKMSKRGLVFAFFAIFLSIIAFFIINNAFHSSEGFGHLAMILFLSGGAFVGAIIFNLLSVILCVISIFKAKKWSLAKGLGFAQLALTILGIVIIILTVFWLILFWLIPFRPPGPTTL
jgi:hypothetical protein